LEEIETMEVMEEIKGIDDKKIIKEII